MSESFIQWVIEDTFIAGRPDWNKVGAEFVESVHAYEEAKIRILNATHSCVAWAGTLKGLNYIHEDVATPEIRQMAYDYVTNDVIPSLHTAEHPCPIDLGNYRDVVLDRFGNSFVCDTNQRVAADGFTKLAGFIAPTIRDRLAVGESISSVARLPALFLAFLEQWHVGKLPFSYQDQVMSPEVGHAICASSDPVSAFINERSCWEELAGNETLRDALTEVRREIQAFVSRA